MQPGDHVVCVKDDEYLLADQPEIGCPLIKGKVYTISAVCTGHPVLAVQVAEHPWLISVDGWYAHWRFRKLSRLTPETFLKESLNA